MDIKYDGKEPSDGQIEIIEKEILGTLSPLMADHMFREECYYLTKLAMVAGTKNPTCDPTKLRTEV